MLKKLVTKATTKVEMMNDLIKLRSDLQKLGPCPSGTAIYDYSVKFFNLIVNFQDKHAMNPEMFKNSVEAGHLFNHIRNAGRDQYGMVRAPRGTAVTLHNLYLGNVYGIWTETAAKFKDSTEKDVQQIIQNQLRGFINSHREPMIELIDEVKNNKTKNPLVRVALKRKQNTK
ncbi:MAG: hypothetical protein IJ560_01850 [Alphaproteobacteria bacterium]|nr:hypothetical protein [Alphaproteobacteria bacterium]